MRLLFVFFAACTLTLERDPPLAVTPADPSPVRSTAQELLQNDLGLGRDAEGRLTPTSGLAFDEVGNASGVGTLGGADVEDCFAIQAELDTTIDAGGTLQSGEADFVYLHIRAPNRWSGPGTVLERYPVLIGTIANVDGVADRPPGEWEVCVSNESGMSATYEISINVLSSPVEAEP